MKNLMICNLFAIIGFAFYFIYDINSIKWENSILHKLFFLGTVLVTLSTVLAFKENINYFLQLAKNSRVITEFVIKILFFLGFLVLLLYTLFFAIPFEATYIEKKKESDYRNPEKEQHVCMTGMYALCRHPGVIWMAGMMFVLWSMQMNVQMGIYAALVIILDFLYVLMQDVWIFPKQFCDYSEYKKNVPFLIPTPFSIKKCWKTINIKNIRRCA